MSTALPFEEPIAGRVNNGFDPLPAGTYPVVIEAFENKLTKDGSGSYAEIKFQVTGGEYNGRTVFSRMTTRNAKQQAVQIGRRQLEELAYATLGDGAVLRDLGQLAAKSLQIEVVVRPDTGYGPQNDVKRFYPTDNQLPSSTAPATGQAAASTNARPWDQ
jgi:hypothetical protein